MTYYMPCHLKRAIRLDLMEQQNGKCAYCSRHLTANKQHHGKARYATIDHLVPLALGGSSRPDNIVLCCRLCNIVKAHSTPEEFVFGLLWIWTCKHLPALSFELYRRRIMPLGI